MASYLPNTRFNWRIFLVLWLASVIGIVAVIPASLTLQSSLLEKADLPIPLGVLLALQVAQNAVLFAAVTALGLFLASRVGLGAPILEKFLMKKKIDLDIKSILLLSIGLGIAVALVIIILELWAFVPALRQELGEIVQPLTPTGVPLPVWQGLLGAFYGGINEEIFMRLFLLSLFAFLCKQVRRTIDGFPTLGALWVANVLAALLFGLGHLPAIAPIVPLSPLVIARVVILNGLGGMVFGYLYFTRGLEAAIISHFTADIVLHVLARLVI